MVECLNDVSNINFELKFIGGDENWKLGVKIEFKISSMCIVYIESRMLSFPQLSAVFN